MMDSVIYWLLENALVTAVLAGLVALVCRITRCRPAIEHALWVLVLLKLVMPPLVHWPEEWREAASAGFALFPAARETPGNETPPPAKAVQPAKTRFEDAPDDALAADPVAKVELEPGLTPRVDVLEGASRGVGLEASEVDPERASPPPRAESVAVPGTRAIPEADLSATERTSPSPAALAAMWLPRAWLGGLLLFLLFHLAWILRFARTLGSARPASPEIRGEVETLASRLGMRAPRTRVLPGAGSPLAWGLGRPTLLLPASLVARLGIEAWRGILLHELAHLRRRDHYAGCLLVAAQCIWWWNPVFWYVRRRLGESAELACDAWVVWAAPDERRVYAESLLDVARSMARGSGRDSPLPLTAFLASRTGRAARHEFERRLTMILTANYGRSVPGLGVLALALLALLAAPSWSAGADSTAGGTPAGEDAGTVDLFTPLAGDPQGEEAGAGAGAESVIVAPMVEVVEEVVVVPGVVTVRENVPVIQLDVGDAAGSQPVVPPHFPGHPAALQSDAGGSFGPAGGLPVPVSGDRASGVAPGHDAARSAPKNEHEHRIERIEKDIEKLEQHLEAVLAELRWLRQAQSGPRVGPAVTRGHATASEPAIVDALPRARVRTPSPRPSSATRLDPAPAAAGDDTGGAGTSRYGARSRSSADSRATPSRPSSSRGMRSLGVAPISPGNASSAGATGIDDSFREPTVRPLTFTRATYRLPPGKAKALAEFLRDHVTAGMELVATDDEITVTASSDAQKTIERLIRLMVSTDARATPTDARAKRARERSPAAVAR